ncbi:reverse transcriptase domain-containing protein [Tanacetum coccineum]
MMDDDYQMAQQLQAEEQEQLSIEEKSKLFVQLLEARKKHFAEIRAREKRNKPPTQAQQRNLYCNYLTNIEAYTLKQFKDSKLVEGSEKRAEDSTKGAGTELEQEVAKKQMIDDAKVDDEQEEARMKELMNIVLDEEEVAIDTIPLATKSLCIVDWKIIKKGKINEFQIIRADGSSKQYPAFIHMLRNFDREDLETLWKLERIAGIKRFIRLFRITAALIKVSAAQEESYAPIVVQQPPTFQPDTRLAIPTFLPTDDPIASLNKAMIFLSSVYRLKFPPISNQLRTSSNPRTQVTIQNGQITVQNVHGRQSQGYASNDGNNQASRARVSNTVGNVGENKPRVIRCYNCNGEGYIAKQCTAKKRVKDYEWFKDKMLLAQAYHVDAYDSDCDDEATTNAIFMANLSLVGSLNDDTVEPRYDFDILFEVPHYDTYHDSNMLNSNIQEVGYIENILSNNESYDELTSNNTQVIPKVVEKNDLSKSVTSHLTTNKLIEKCIKFLALRLLKIESEPINAYFKNNRAVHRNYLKVTKENVATLHELLEEARALKPLDEHIGRVSSTNASGSKPKSNTKNDRIPQPSNRSKKNKVEAHHRKFKSSANMNC